ncbi:PREDICTED: metalloprotease TIKI1-like [Tauraco erythrolophus]|uniref:metalloprotease TIKI1-like n=1 Tax=Tauraco erythrolophus TaxID=121530 RepID=UPI000523C57F|nr:PREDICTED: metalloprotease TIKI1-like [Tauraco erythrolophus]
MWTGMLEVGAAPGSPQHAAVVFALNQTLLQQESLRAGSFQIPYTTEDLIKHYNCGDLSSIIFNHDTSQVPNFINATLPAHERITAQEIDSYFRQELIYKRNERMGRRVKDLLEKYPDKSFFFAFGAGHFMGNNTVVDVLRREGYEVEHTPAGQTINNRKAPKTLLAFSSSTPAHSPYVVSQELTLPLHPRKEEEEEEEFLPHLLLPDSMDMLEKVDRKYKKKKKKQQKKQRLRQFNDLWVRLEESATDPPPRIRIINGYITVEPQPRGHGRSSHAHADTASAHQLSLSLFLSLLTLTLHMIRLH